MILETFSRLISKPVQEESVLKMAASSRYHHICGYSTAANSAINPIDSARIAATEKIEGMCIGSVISS